MSQQSAEHVRERVELPQLTADLLSGGAGLFEEGVREGLARRGLAGPAASHRADTVVSPGADHGHVDPFDQSGQSRRSVPYGLPSPRLRSLTEKTERMKTVHVTN